MLENPQTEEQMIEEGAEFKVGRIYYKTIKGKLYRTQLDSELWEPTYLYNRSYYEALSGFVDLRVKAKEDNCNMKNELYASLELQISMAQDYSEWLKQETKRNDELLNAHSTALRRLNNLLIQSQPEEVKVPEIGCEGVCKGGGDHTNPPKTSSEEAKEEVVRRFCALASQVGGSFEFKHKLHHDCFCCEAGSTEGDFQFDEEIIEYIEKIVMASLGVRL